MAIGFTLLDATVARPDKGGLYDYKQRLRTAKFGDGYQQRINLGISSTDQLINIRFNTRPEAEIDEIKLFLVARSEDGASFTYTYSDHTTGGTPVETAIKVVCDSWVEVQNYESYYSLSAVFRRVFDA